MAYSTISAAGRAVFIGSVFEAFASSHQRYFSNWIESAKTEPTRTKRLTIALDAPGRGLDFGTMIREQKGKNNPAG